VANQTPLTTKQAVAGAIAFFGLIISVGANLAIGLTGIRGPLTPDPSRGLVVPFHDHDIVHYVTRTFDMWSGIAAGAQFLFMVLLALVVASVVIRNHMS
jgi:hypothetical protein